MSLIVWGTWILGPQWWCYLGKLKKCALVLGGRFWEWLPLLAGPYVSSLSFQLQRPWWTLLPLELEAPTLSSLSRLGHGVYHSSRTVTDTGVRWGKWRLKSWNKRTNSRLYTPPKMSFMYFFRSCMFWKILLKIYIFNKTYCYFLKSDISLHICVCVFVCTCMCVFMWVPVETREGLRNPVGMTGGCEPSDVGAGNQALILCKSCP